MATQPISQDITQSSSTPMVPSEIPPGFHQPAHLPNQRASLSPFSDFDINVGSAFSPINSSQAGSIDVLTVTPSHNSTVATPPLSSSHSMVTRSRNDIFKPKAVSLGLLAEADPTTAKAALQDQKWVSTIQKEFHALQKNHTWSLVPYKSDMNVVGCKWVFRTKFKQDDILLRHKTRLVAKRFHQTLGLDFLDTFSPAVKASTI